MYFYSFVASAWLLTESVINPAQEARRLPERLQREVVKSGHLDSNSQENTKLLNTEKSDRRKLNI